MHRVRVGAPSSPAALEARGGMDLQGGDGETMGGGSIVASGGSSRLNDGGRAALTGGSGDSGGSVMFSAGAGSEGPRRRRHRHERRERRGRFLERKRIAHIGGGRLLRVGM